MSAARPGRTLLVLATVVVALALGAGLWTIGSPGAHRDRRLDDRREEQLSHLSQAILEHWKEKGALPANLEALASKPGVRLAVADPVTNEPYGYTVTGDKMFRLCATFATDSSKVPLTVARKYDKRFAHGVGLTCFDRKVEPRSAAAAVEVE